MPELPEVELARRNLERWFHGRRAVRAEAEDTRIFRGADPAEFTKVRGALVDIVRRGKYLLLTFEKGRGLLAHLGMTGKFVRRPDKSPEPWSRARWVLDSGEVIHFRDPRLFGRMEPVPAARLASLEPIKALGRDPLVDGLTAAQLQEAVGPSRQDVKVALMDQGRVAGLGNIQASEALFRARLHPARKPATLSDAEWKALTRGIFASLRYTLKSAEGEEIEYVEERGAKNPFWIYGRAGEKCRRCGTIVRSFTQGGRTTHACPHCQPQKS